MALHYQQMMKLFHAVPVTVAVGGSNTCKTFMAKLAASLFGLHRSSIWGKLTEAKGESFMDKLVFFVLNDPKDHVAVQDLVMKVSIEII